MTDPIADYLTRLRNAIKANHRVVEVPASNIKKEITKILFEQGYILNYKFIEGNTPAGAIKIALKYDPVDRVNAIKVLKRVSRPTGVSAAVMSAALPCMHTSLPSSAASMPRRRSISRVMCRYGAEVTSPSRTMRSGRRISGAASTSA